MEFKNITLASFEQIIKKTDESILGIFFGTWCPYCQSNIPEIISYFSEMNAHYNVYLVSILETDAVWSEDKNNNWNLNKIPTFRFYNKEKIIFQHEGLIKPKKLEKFIKQYLVKK